MLANSRKAATTSGSPAFAIALPTGLYSGAAGNSDKKFDDLLGTGSILRLPL
jgi:hypothetical protein